MAIELKLKINDYIIGYRPKTIGEPTKKCVILAPWLPQYIDKYHPFIETCMEIDLDLFVIRYTGSRENPWKFSLLNSINDIEQTIRFIKQGNATSVYDKSKIVFNYETIYLIGFSYWWLPTLFSSHKDNVKKFLICPFVNYKYHKPWDIWENIDKTLIFINEAYGNLYNIEIENLINEIKNIDYSNSDKKSQYNLIIGEKDTSIPIDEIEWLKNNYNIENFILQKNWHSLNVSWKILSSLL